MVWLFVNSFCTALAVYIIMLKINVRRFAGHDWIVDVVFSVLVALFFAGTFSGAVVGITSGFCMSILMRVTRWTIGYEKFNWRTRTWVRYPSAFVRRALS